MSIGPWSLFVICSLELHSLFSNDDRNVLIDHKLGAGQGDGLPIERGIELNRVPVAGRGDRIAELTSAAISHAGDDERGRVNTFGAGRRRAKQSEELQPA